MERGIMRRARRPDERLRSAVPYITKNARIADIGTDHAYLPIYLIREGIASQALVCDINRGPLESALSNIREAGLSDRMEVLQTDGLHGVAPFAPDQILIFGMGGELIVRILSEAPWIRSSSVGLILQPMTRAETVRAWLWDNGFSVTGETLTQDGGRIYQTIAARFCGQTEAYTEEERLLGKENIRHGGDVFRAFLRHEIAVYETICNGKSNAADTEAPEERQMLAKLKKRLEESK